MGKAVKMTSPKSDRKASVPCDFCSKQIAVLYCRADSAKLCLFCDQHVHSANLLSRKHLRSQICDNCSSEPVSVRCATDNLVLCQECDWDAHGSCSVSASHDRIPIEGFSGCPSALDLASLWGFNLQDKKWDHYHQSEPLIQNWSVGDGAQDLVMQVEQWVYKPSFQDVMVPNDDNNNNNNNAMAYGNVSDGEMVKRQQGAPSCGKYKHVIYKQLVELFERDLMGGDGGDGGGGGGGENLVPRTPSRSGWQGNVEAADFRNGNDGVISDATAQLQQQQVPFTSLLMLPSQDLKPRDMMWNGNATAHGTQVIIKIFTMLMLFIVHEGAFKLLKIILGKDYVETTIIVTN